MCCCEIQPGNGNTLMAKHGIELPTRRQVQERRRFYRSTCSAVQRTLGTLPQVVAVLLSTEDGEPRLVTVLSERSDEAILRVADQELALMGALGGIGFDFWTAEEGDLPSYLDAGYAVVFEKQEHDDTHSA